MKSSVAYTALLCIIPMFVASDTLRGVKSANEVRELRNEIGNEDEAYYDRELANDEYDRYLAEYDNYYRNLQNKSRYLQEDEDINRDLEEEDDGRYLTNDEDEDRRLQRTAADAFARSNYYGGVPQASRPILYGAPGTVSTADASAIAATRGGAYNIPGEFNCLGEGCPGFPATVPGRVPASGIATANAQARANLNQGSPAVFGGPISAAEARARAEASTGGAIPVEVPLPGMIGGTLTHSSMGENTFASRTVGPGYASSTAVAGSPTGGLTRIKEGYTSGFGAGQIPAATAGADARARVEANFGYNPFYTPTQRGGIAQADAAANARFAGAESIPQGPVQVDPAGITYFPANTR